MATEKLTATEAGVGAQCSARTIMRAVHEGELAAEKRGGRLLIDRAELDRWVLARQARQERGRRATPLGRVSGRVLRALRFEVEATR